MKDENGRGRTPPALSELHALRIDFEDVEVESLGGHTVRLWALSGTARAQLMSAMVDLSEIADEQARDPVTVKRVFEFQIRVVAASMGYPQELWDQVGEVMGAGTIEELFRHASSLSGLDAEAQDKAVQRLRRARRTASGTA